MLSFTRLRVVPHFSSVIVERAKRERAWKSPHAVLQDLFTLTPAHPQITPSRPKSKLPRPAFRFLKTSSKPIWTLHLTLTWHDAYSNYGFDKVIVKAMAGVVYLHNCIYMGKPLGSRFWQFITLYNYQFHWAIAFNIRTPSPLPGWGLTFSSYLWRISLNFIHPWRRP